MTTSQTQIFPISRNSILCFHLIKLSLGNAVTIDFASFFAVITALTVDFKGTSNGSTCTTEEIPECHLLLIRDTDNIKAFSKAFSFIDVWQFPVLIVTSLSQVDNMIMVKRRFA